MTRTGRVREGGGFGVPLSIERYGSAVSRSEVLDACVVRVCNGTVCRGCPTGKVVRNISCAVGCTAAVVVVCYAVGAVEAVSGKRPRSIIGMRGACRAAARCTVATVCNRVGDGRPLGVVGKMTVYSVVVLIKRERTGFLSGYLGHKLQISYSQMVA